MKEFIDYVMSFYGPDGVYGKEYKMRRMEVNNAIKVYFKRIEEYEWLEWGNGDSLDRERVRDIVIEQRIKFKNKMAQIEVFMDIVDLLIYFFSTTIVLLVVALYIMDKYFE